MAVPLQSRESLRLNIFLGNNRYKDTAIRDVVEVKFHVWLSVLANFCTNCLSFLLRDTNFKQKTWCDRASSGKCNNKQCYVKGLIVATLEKLVFHRLKKPSDAPPYLQPY